MSNHRYLIGTSYFANPERKAEIEWFFGLWRKRIAESTSPQMVSVIAVAGCEPPQTPLDTLTNEHCMDLSGDLGSVGSILNHGNPNFMSSYMASVMVNAWIAYTNECDFIGVEQDALCYGQWVNALYRDCGGGGAVFGRCKLMGSANSLMLIRHNTIPQFVADYLNTGPLHIQSLAEHKLTRLAEEHPSRYSYFSFGYGRDRPINYNDPVWYAQKFTRDELLELGRRGLVDVADMPKEAVAFTNTD